MSDAWYHMPAPRILKAPAGSECRDCGQPATHMSNLGDESYDPRPYCADCHNEDDDESE